MIRPGGKLAQPQYADVRPKIERNIRIVVLAFGVFFFFILTLPFSEDLIQLAATQKLLRITEVVRSGHSGYRSGPRLSVSLSGSQKDYTLYYPTKTLNVGDNYEFVVLPRSRVILDYRELAK